MTKHAKTKYVKIKKKMVDFIGEYWSKYVKTPSYREIARKFKLSTSTVSAYLDKLNEENLIEIDAHVIYPYGMRKKIRDAVLAFLDLPME